MIPPGHAYFLHHLLNGIRRRREKFSQGKGNGEVQEHAKGADPPRVKFRTTNSRRYWPED